MHIKQPICLIVDASLLDFLFFYVQLLQQATSSSNLGAFSGIQQMAGKWRKKHFILANYALFSTALKFFCTNDVLLKRDTPLLNSQLKHLLS